MKVIRDQNVPKLEIYRLRLFHFFLLLISLTDCNSFAFSFLDKCVTGNFFGDFYVKSSLTQKADAYFQNLDPILKKADFNVANFEGSLTDGHHRVFPVDRFPYALGMDSQICKILDKHHIHFVTRANNHAMDFGSEAMEKTSQCLQSHDIQFAGVGPNADAARRPMYYNKNGIKIAIYSSTTTLPRAAWATKDSPGVAVAHLPKKQDENDHVDFRVYVIHWGEELSLLVTPHHKSFAAHLGKAPDSLVLGHHAHIAQEVGHVRGKWFAYGLGNFIFTSRGKPTPLSLGERVEFCKSVGGEKKFNVAFYPLNTDALKTHFATQILSEMEVESFFKPYKKESLFPFDMEFLFKK